MILYTEKQLEDSYNVYRRMQIKKDMAFVSLDDFRIMFETIMEIAFKEEIGLNNYTLHRSPYSSTSVYIVI